MLTLAGRDEDVKVVSVEMEDLLELVLAENKVII